MLLIIQNPLFYDGSGTTQMVSTAISFQWIDLYNYKTIVNYGGLMFTVNALTVKLNLYNVFVSK